MKPKNSRDRRNSFLKYLALFLVTVSTIVAAIYFNFEVPSKSNELLRAKVKINDQDINFQNSFYDEMVSIKNMIDSLDDIPKGDVSFHNSLISDKIVELQKSIPIKDSTYRYNMYMNIAKLQRELKSAKIELLSLSDAKSKIEDYQVELTRLRDELRGTKRDLANATH